MLIRAFASPERLAVSIRTAIASLANDLFASAVTAWDIAIKGALGRITFPIDDYDAILARLNVVSLPITHDHAIAAGSLPRHHNDPFDRLLVGQARVENMTVVSVDAAIALYDVTLLRDVGP